MEKELRPWLALLIFGLLLNVGNAIINPPVKADPPQEDPNFWEMNSEPEPYTVFEQPHINTGKFWRFMRNHATWDLRYKQGGHWIYVNDSMHLGLKEKNDRMKIWLNFTAPYQGTYRLNIKINISVISYSLNTTTNIFSLNYMSFGHLYTFRFNYSDLKKLSGLTFLYGIVNEGGYSYFQFNVTKTGIPAGREISLDPEYQIDAYPQTGTDASGYNHQRKFVRTSDGTFHLVFYGAYGAYQSTSYTRSVNGGLTWSSPVNLSRFRKGEYPASICVDKSDILTVVWSGYCGNADTTRNLQYVRSTDKGLTWSTATNITSVSYDTLWAAIAVDSSNRVHCAFTTYTAARTTRYQIQYTMYSSGAWSAPINLTNIAYTQSLPSICVDTLSNVHLVWQGASAATGVYFQTQIKYAVKTNATSTWSAQPHKNLTRTAHAQTYPCIASTGTGDVVVVWTGRHAGSTTNYQVRFTRYYLANTSWQIKPYNLTTDTTYAQALPSMSVDYQNNLHVMWSGKYPGSATFHAARHLTFYNATGLWVKSLDTINAAANCLYPSSMWSYRPTVNGNNISRPKSGYCFFFCNGTTLKFWRNTTLTFDGSTYISPPNISGESPANGSTGVAYPTTTCININYDGFSASVYMERYEYYVAAMTGVTYIGKNQWRSQNFTIGNTGTNEDFYITNVTLKINKCNGEDPGTVTVSIRSDISGPDLCIGYTDGNTLQRDVDVPDYTLRNISMSPNVLLSASTMYYIIVRATAAPSANSLGWHVRSPGAYTGGWMDASSNSGLTWTNGTYHDYDYWFNVWGLSINGTYVTYEFWTNESGTWMIYNSSIAWANGTYCADNNFTLNNTVYYWNISVYATGHGYVNESYHFTTGAAAGGVTFIPSHPGRWGGALLLSLGLLFVVPFFFVWRRRKRKVVASMLF